VRLGMEATGYSHWFEQLLAELGVEVWIGGAATLHLSLPPNTAESQGAMVSALIWPYNALPGRYEPPTLAARNPSGNKTPCSGTPTVRESLTVSPGIYIGGEESKPNSEIPVQRYASRPLSTNVVGGLWKACRVRFGCKNPLRLADSQQGEGV
jgi:hypothetical protein